MNSHNQWNRLAHVGTFVLGYAWGCFAVISGKAPNVTFVAVAVGVVTVVALVAYLLSPENIERARLSDSECELTPKHELQLFVCDVIDPNDPSIRRRPVSERSLQRAVETLMDDGVLEWNSIPPSRELGEN